MSDNWNFEHQNHLLVDNGFKNEIKYFYDYLINI